MSRRFTVEEADALLPELRERLARIERSRRIVIAGTRRVDARLQEDGGGVADPELFEASRTLRAEVEALNRSGVILRDADAGLIDFPTLREGEPAYLCWRAEEPAVAYWHPEDTGFSGRCAL